MKIEKHDLLMCILSYEINYVWNISMFLFGMFLFAMIYFYMENFVGAIMIFIISSYTFKKALYYKHHQWETIKEYKYLFGKDELLEKHYEKYS